MAISFEAADIRDLSGTRVAITGANSGLGFETARALVAKGADVTILCRSVERAKGAAARMSHGQAGTVHIVQCDVSDLNSVADAAAALHDDGDHLDVLINNAGVMGTPYSCTPQGVELQLATNHLGHFALTALSFDLLVAAPSARVVTVSSNLHKRGRLDLDDLGATKGYGKTKAYAASKLANLLFALELDRRLRRVGSSVKSVAAHPGWARSSLAANGPAQGRSERSARLGAFVGAHMGQKTAKGALPILYAATGLDVDGGDYFGPSGLMELYGSPKRVEPSKRAHDHDLATRLFAESSRVTGVTFPLG